MEGKGKGRVKGRRESEREVSGKGSTCHLLSTVKFIERCISAFESNINYKVVVPSLPHTPLPAKRRELWGSGGMGGDALLPCPYIRVMEQRWMRQPLATEFPRRERQMTSLTQSFLPWTENDDDADAGDDNDETIILIIKIISIMSQIFFSFNFPAILLISSLPTSFFSFLTLQAALQPSLPPSWPFPSISLNDVAGVKVPVRPFIQVRCRAMEARR